MTREQLTGRAWLLYQQLCDYGMQADADDIMLAHGAAEDDSDTEEGFFVTMSDKDVVAAIRDMQSRLDEAMDRSYETYELELNPKQVNFLIDCLKAAKANDPNGYVDVIINQLM